MKNLLENMYCSKNIVNQKIIQAVIDKNQKVKPSESLSGTYEEMYSNWRNKVEQAANNHDSFASFMNMCSFQLMLFEIMDEVEIGEFSVMKEYNSDFPEDNVKIFDKYLQKYEQVYKQAGISIKRYSDVEEFVTDYLCQ